MRAMLQNLVQHKGWADASLLRAIRQHDKAAQDDDLRRLLHHANLANRFWLMQNLGRPFTLEEEAPVPESLEGIASRYLETYADELKWISHLAESHLDNLVESPFIP